MVVFVSTLLTAGNAYADKFKADVYTKLPDTPKGLCVDSKGNLYASLVHAGQVVKLLEDGKYEHVAWVPSKEDGEKGGIYGMATDKGDNIYIAYMERSKCSNLMDPFHTDCRDATVKKAACTR